MNDTIGTMRISLVDGQPVVEHADDLIEVSGELANTLGVAPPLDGRVEFVEGYRYDLSMWNDTGRLPGRTIGTYLGRRVHP